MTHEQIEEIAVEAAKLYGQEWGELSPHTKDIWRENVRHDHAVVDSEVLRCAVRAKEQWLEKQAEPPVEKKTRKKRGED